MTQGGADGVGDGLWRDGQQIAGTSQFSLRGIKDKAGKIRRNFE